MICDKKHNQLGLDVPEGFAGVYPTGFGVVRSDSYLLNGNVSDSMLLLVCSGGGVAVVDEYCFRYAPGYVLPVRHPHKLRMYSDRGGELMYVTLAQPGGLLSSLDTEEKFFRVDADCRGERGLRELVKRYESGRVDDIWTESAELYAVIMALSAAKNSDAREYSPLVEDALRSIRSNFAFIGGIDGLAAELGVARSHLIRSFSAQVGCSPGRYLQKTRLDYAKMLLFFREYSVDAVAKLSGYSCANYFCKVFKKETGLSPAEYRRFGSRPPAGFTAPVFPSDSV